MNTRYFLNFCFFNLCYQFKTFHHTNISYLWLNLFLILWCLCYWKWDYFLNFLQIVLQIVYSNVTDFSVLILDPATLLNSCVSSNEYFFLGSLGFSICKIKSPAIRYNFISLFPICLKENTRVLRTYCYSIDEIL